MLELPRDILSDNVPIIRRKHEDAVKIRSTEKMGYNVNVTLELITSTNQCGNSMFH